MACPISSSLVLAGQSAAKLPWMCPIQDKPVKGWIDGDDDGRSSHDDDIEVLMTMKMIHMKKMPRKATMITADT